METGITKTSENRMVTFVEKGIETIEGAMQVANFLLESKIIPYYYYEKLPNDKPDFTKGKAGAVAGILLHGVGTLHLPAMTALQNIVPVNGLLSLKGDLAKSMIFSSGVLRKDSWKEIITGTIENEDMEVSITATREDNGLTLTKSFSINDAKRAGLWITLQQINGQDGWKYKSSPWWKYQKRMLYYRPLGYLARDLFGDVLNNMYITEEAMDISQNTTEIIDTPDGNKIIIPDKEHSKKRSGKMTERVVDKIDPDKFAPVGGQENIQDAVVLEKNSQTLLTEAGEKIVEEIENQIVPFTGTKGSAEYFQGKLIKVDGAPVDEQGNKILPPETKETPKEGQLTLEQMEGMDIKKLLEKINVDTDMIEAMATIPGKNTNKKLREIIFAHQKGTLAEHVAHYMKSEKGQNDDLNDKFDIHAAGQMTEENAGAGIKPNKDFEKQDAGKSNADLLLPDSSEMNKYNLTVPEYDKGDGRDFATMKQLFNALVSVNPPINNPRYLELAAKMGILERFKDREMFCKYASVAEICKLLNEN